jgi:tRNA A58 N-methylase Trm61
MGTLRKWELKDNGCNIFFETGTGTAASLEHALNNGKFDKLYSVEINTETAEKAKKKFNKNNKVTILN